MDEKRDLLGVSIDNISVVKAMELVRGYMETEALNTIGMITIDVLLEASGSEKYQEKLKQLDFRRSGDYFGGATDGSRESVVYPYIFRIYIGCGKEYHADRGE